MAQVDHEKREVTFKVVYCGPPGGGKTTNLAAIHERLNPEVRGDLVSMATSTDSTVFLDYVHVEAIVINGYDTRFQLYTVPGQPRYDATRELLLKGADGIIFVADSKIDCREENVMACQTMYRNLEANGIGRKDIPIVYQYNKRDLSNTSSLAAMDQLFMLNDTPSPQRFEASAQSYRNVVETLDAMTQMILESFHAKRSKDIRLGSTPS